MTSPNILNLILFQLGWFACVLPAAAGLPWVGPLFVGAWVSAFALWVRMKPRAALIFPLAFLIGCLFDSALVLLGLVRFPDPTQFGGPAPIWMAFMWVNLAATLDSCLGWLRERYVLGGALGLLGGPLAYWGGDRLGGIELVDPLVLSLGAVGIEWAVAFPLLLWLNEKIRPIGD